MTTKVYYAEEFVKPGNKEEVEDEKEQIEADARRAGLEVRRSFTDQDTDGYRAYIGLRGSEDAFRSFGYSARKIALLASEEI